nr:sucrase-isomaltase, intestinal-like [Lytechinus pictus]
MEFGNKVIVLLVVAIVVTGIGLGVGLTRKKPTITVEPEPTPTEGPKEPVQEALQRIDCYPDPGATEQSCEERGCRWSSSDVDGAPWCYYPKQVDVPGYTMVSASVKNALGFEAILQRRDTPVRYDRPVQRLLFQVEIHSETRVPLQGTSIHWDKNLDTDGLENTERDR